MHTPHTSLLPRRRPGPVATVASGGDITDKSEHSLTQTSPFAWPSKFYVRHQIAFQWENTAWALNKKIEHQLESPGDVMCFILRTDEDSARYEGRIRPILDICHDVEFEDLLAGKLDGTCRKMGWIIDGYYRQEKKTPWASRRPRGALSACDMANLLLEKRYVKFSAHDNELDDPQAIDAERRLIYVTDIDSWGILALIMTSPESQARLLAGFLQRHLCARSSIGVSIAADGPSIFALDFHIPFRVWRTTDQLLCDPRVKASTGETLRSSRNMKFLMGSTDYSSTPKIDGIYSGHVGCLITGYDQWRWTAILSTDTWFNTGEGAIDKVERYQFDLEGGMLLDPLGGGQDDAEKPIWEPRAYFLRVLLLRLAQVADEWELIRNKLETGVTNLSQRQQQLFLRLRPFSTGSDPEEYGQEFEGFEGHLRYLKETVQELLHDLYETLKIGEGFLNTEVNYFRNDEGRPGDASECYPSLSGIRRIFNELSQLYTVFVGLKDKCENMASKCEEARRKYFFQGIQGVGSDSLAIHDAGNQQLLSDNASKKELVQTKLDLANVTSEVKECRIETMRKIQEHHENIRELQVERTRLANHYYEHSRKFQIELIHIAKTKQENFQELRENIREFQVEAKRFYDQHQSSQAELVHISKTQQKNIQALQDSVRNFQGELGRFSEEGRKNMLEVRILAWLTLILVPPFLASAFFSAEGAMPFKQNLVSFVILSVAIIISMFAIYGVLKLRMNRNSDGLSSPGIRTPTSLLPVHTGETFQTDCSAVGTFSPVRTRQSSEHAETDLKPTTTAGMRALQRRDPVASASNSTASAEGSGKTSWGTSLASLGVRRTSKEIDIADVEAGSVVQALPLAVLAS